MTPEGTTPEAPKGKTEEAPTQQQGAEPAPAGPPHETAGQLTVPTTGTRLAFRDIRRQLTEDDLKQPGVQKLLIEDFERAEAECDRLQTYVERYHAADRRVGILEENLKTSVALEIITGVGLTAGGAIMSLAPYFWDANTTKGQIALGVGFLLIAGSAIARAVRVWR